MSPCQFEPFYVYAICFNPSGFPGVYVVRRWKILPGRTEPDHEYLLAETLEQARSLIPEGMVCIGRNPQDDPVIVETWI